MYQEVTGYLKKVITTSETEFVEKKTTTTTAKNQNKPKKPPSKQKSSIGRINRGILPNIQRRASSYHPQTIPKIFKKMEKSQIYFMRPPLS